ncbi:hypothetical protein Psch_00580 [Pelotomaculum schinkii]|uniref:Uncharacterized protein n=1 Tax=Pelotomaculum schinkii TaxID=78350 RepID=A0A4Y7RE29_9FIRM|nr:hypothetical protein Psch_00580 [Pelotomaculum schinkii]
MAFRALKVWREKIVLNICFLQKASPKKCCSWEILECFQASIVIIMLQDCWRGLL